MLRTLFLAVLAAASPVLADDPPKTAPAKPDGDVIVSKLSAGDVTGTVVKVSAAQLTLKVPQQVPDGFTTQSVRVPAPSTRPGHPPTYHTVRQQVPKFKTVQAEMTFDIGGTATVKTAAGKATDLSAVQPNSPVMIHLTKVKESKPGEKTESHVEVTRIVVPTAPPVGVQIGSSPAVAKKK